MLYITYTYYTYYTFTILYIIYITIQRIVPLLDTTACSPDSDEIDDDILMAECLWEGLQIRATDTRDDHQRQRFHPFTPGMHLQYKIPTAGPPEYDGDWYPREDSTIKEGYECCSIDSISFHYCHADVMRQLYSYVYNCDKRKYSK